MTTHLSRYAFALALVAASAGAPLVPALAASATSPNATTDVGMARASATSVYSYDQYRDAKGFPLPGWEYLFFPAE